MIFLQKHHRLTNPSFTWSCNYQLIFSSVSNIKPCNKYLWLCVCVCICVCKCVFEPDFEVEWCVTFINPHAFQSAAIFLPCDILGSRRFGVSVDLPSTPKFTQHNRTFFQYPSLNFFLLCPSCPLMSLFCPCLSLSTVCSAFVAGFSAPVAESRGKYFYIFAPSTSMPSWLTCFSWPHIHLWQWLALHEPLERMGLMALRCCWRILS